MDFMLVKNGFEMVPTFPYDHNSFVDVVVFEQYAAHQLRYCN